MGERRDKYVAAAMAGEAIKGTADEEQKAAEVNREIVAAAHDWLPRPDTDEPA